jgi:hypothetical protein
MSIQILVIVAYFVILIAVALLIWPSYRDCNVSSLPDGISGSVCPPRLLSVLCGSRA